MNKKQSLRLFLGILKDNCRIETDSEYIKQFKKKPISTGSCAATMLTGMYYGFNQSDLLALLGLWMCIWIGIIRIIKKLKQKQ